MQKKMKFRAVSKRGTLLLGTALVGGSLASILAPGGAYAVTNCATTGTVVNCSGVGTGTTPLSTGVSGSTTNLNLQGTGQTAPGGQFDYTNTAAGSGSSFGIFVNQPSGGGTLTIDMGADTSLKSSNDALRLRKDTGATGGFIVNINGDLEATGYNNNGEALDVHANGQATGYTGNLIEVNIGVNSTLTSGASDGMAVVVDSASDNYGDVEINMHGQIYATGSDSDGILAIGRNGALNITVDGEIGSDTHSVGDDGVDASTTGGNITLKHYGNSIYAVGDGLTTSSVTGAISITNGDSAAENPDGHIEAGGSAIVAGITSAGATSAINIYSNGVLNAGAYGISASNAGTSATSDIIIETGRYSDITATNTGIIATASGGDIQMTIRGTVDSTTANALQATAVGAGTIDITVYGDLTDGGGAGDAGISASSVNGAITITTGRASDIFGGQYGIRAQATGTGSIEMNLSGDITTDSLVNATAAVSAQTTSGAIDIRTGRRVDIASEYNGIEATSESGTIRVFNRGSIGSFDFNTLTFDTVGNNGITASVTSNSASGANVLVFNTGLVAAAKTGISVSNAANTDTTPDPDNEPITAVLNAGVVYGAVTGISATSSNGEAFVGNFGLVFGGSGATAAVEFNTADGGFLYNRGVIASAGSVEAVSNLLQDLYLYPTASLYELAGQVAAAVQAGGYAGDLAVLGTAGEVTIHNDGILIGRVTLNGTNGWNDIINDALWVTTGSNLVNGDVENNGWIQTAVGSGAETTTFSGVAASTWVNNGTISLQDGAANDLTQILGASGTNNGVTFNAQAGSAVYVDSYLGAPGSASDVLQIGSNIFNQGGIAQLSGGSTALYVNDLNAGPGAYNPQGILVVNLPGATLGTNFQSNSFVLSQYNVGYDPNYRVIDKGYFDYALIGRDDISGGEGFYLVGLPGVEAYQLPSLITGAQSIWHDTTGVWLDRQADLRSYLVSPMASAPATTMVTKEQGLVTKAPVAAAPNVTPGVWGKVLGSWASRDASQTYSIYNNNFGYNTGYSQDTYGFIAGADFGKTTGDSAWIFGVLGGYINSKVSFDSAGTTAQYSGGTVGGYITYLNRGFFIDGLVKADFLDMDYKAPGLGYGYTGETASVTNIGFTVDTGYRFAFAGTNWFEPVATLSYVNTQIDDLTGFDPSTRVQFQDGESLRGAIGARVGGKVYEAAAYRLEASATGRFWYEFEGNNQAWIYNAGDDFSATDNFDGGFGEVTGSLNIFGKDNGWNGFLNGSYLFNGNYNNGSGKVGVRYQW